MGRTLFLVGMTGGIGALFCASGCGLILGLSEYEEVKTTGNGGAGGVGEGGGGGAGGSGGACEPAVACYSGPDGTEGVGACKAGMTCEGGCQGEVLPNAETCGDPADEDCNGSDCMLWAKTFENPGYALGRNVAVDPQGNVLVTGPFKGTIAFDPSKPVSVNSNGLYLAKFDAQGSPLWSKSFEHTSSPQGIVADSEGNVIITGTFAGKDPVNCGIL